MSIQVVVGDCVEVMRGMPEKTFNTCVTSPPYFGLRDYGHDGQIGLEETPDAYVSRLVEVFREVRRVLRDDGTLWLNLGDSYVGTGAKGAHVDPKHPQGRNAQHETPKNYRVEGLKSKDLIGIPWRVAFALQADGWYLRQDIIWHKPNPMPESVTDRCTKAHEYVFLLSKSPRYYYDHEAVKEPASNNPVSAARRNRNDFCTVGTKAIQGTGYGQSGQGQNAKYKGETRNRRSVWTVTTKPFKGAHFATFPTELVEPCILAGSPECGQVLDPFGGAGTTGLVASRLGRSATLIELNPDYADMARGRLSEDAGLFA